MPQQGKHLNSRSGIFPRLHGSVEETKVKLAPVHTELTASLKVGHLTQRSGGHWIGGAEPCELTLPYQHTPRSGRHWIPGRQMSSAACRWGEGENLGEYSPLLV